MKKSLLKEVLASAGVSPSKKMGQNFIVDDNFLDCLAREAGLAKGDKVLEVGPGFGALSSRMLDAGAELVSIEFDRKIAAWLKANLVPKGMRLIEADACKVDLPEVFGNGVPFRFISNLPYSAGTVVVAKLMEMEFPPYDIMIMLQKEVAMRLAASPGTPQYGSLSVRAQAICKVESVRNAPPQIFHPEPEVESSIVRMSLMDGIPDFELRQTLSKVVKLGFSHRRKKMLKQLASLFGMDSVKAAYSVAGIDPDIRAEKVPVQQFITLSQELLRSLH